MNACLTIRDSIHRYLTSVGGQTVATIVKDTGFTVAQVSMVLYDGNGGGSVYFAKHGIGGRHHPHTWTAIVNAIPAVCHSPASPSTPERKMLAIKPTRREIVKLAMDAHRGKLQDAAKVQNTVYRDAQAASDKAALRISELAEADAKAAHASFLTKLQKLVVAEFPGATVTLQCELERDGHTNERKIDVVPTVRLHVSACKKHELPEKVRNAMADSRDENLKCRKQTDVEYKKLCDLNTTIRKFEDTNCAYKELLASVFASLDDEAIPHIDALIGMVGKSLEKTA